MRGNGNYLGQVFYGVQRCRRCHGKGFLKPDGTASNAFEGSDHDAFIDCPDCQPEVAATSGNRLMPIVRVTLDIRTEADPAAVALMIEHHIDYMDTTGTPIEVVAASGKRLEAGEPQVGSEHVG